MKIFGHRFLSRAKDGGPQSTVTGYWLVEIKWLFSIALLRFDHGSRDEFHSHAFGCISWLLRGKVYEQTIGDPSSWRAGRWYRPSWLPIITRRSTFHRVLSEGTTWVLTFRGPWRKTWSEFDPKTKKFSTLTYGRKIVEATR